MGVITMVSTSSLINSLTQDFPEFIFQNASAFWWSAQQKTVYIDPNAQNAASFILHELSHAVLGHQGYKRDIDLIKLERDAWDYAQNTLAPRYKITLHDDHVQDNLETYREWLHSRSTCPECDTTGLQMKTHIYRCLTCGHLWRVNEARLCALRRYSTI